MSGKATNYKRWSFRFIVYILLLQGTIFYKMYTYKFEIHDPSDYGMKISIASITAVLLLFPGIIFTLLAIVNKEKKDYKYFFSLLGFPLFLIYVLILFINALSGGILSTYF